MSNHFRLVVFDLDGTLARPRSGWIYIHSLLGTEGGSKESEKLYFSGKISWQEWAERDARLWAGASLEKISNASKRIPLNPGAVKAVKTLQKAGYEVVIISAGLMPIARAVADRLGISRAFANELVDDGEALTGEVKTWVSASNKHEVLRGLLEEMKLEPHQVVAVGDDFSMIPLFREVGLSIAFNPMDSSVGESAKIVVKDRDLSSVLQHILGHGHPDA
jgi:phosphoserine phosphatase